jgi:hypothetical protein
MQKHASHSSWQELVASPRRASHLAQICDNDAFLAAGAGLFATEGLSRGEVVLLTGTQCHLRDIRVAMRSHGVDVDAALARGQLVVADAEASSAALLTDGTLDAARFRAFAGTTLARTAADARFSGTRWWGETSHLLAQRGNTAAALGLEALATEVAAAHDCTFFCSYLLDRFDARAYDGILRDVCVCHSHVIPAEDYVRHRLAVNQAVAEVIGEIRGTMLQSLLSWQGLDCELPSSQALLFWLRETHPDRFHEVLARARACQLEGGS